MPDTAYVTVRRRNNSGPTIVTATTPKHSFLISDELALMVGIRKSDIIEFHPKMAMMRVKSSRRTRRLLVTAALEAGARGKAKPNV